MFVWKNITHGAETLTMAVFNPSAVSKLQCRLRDGCMELNDYGSPDQNGSYLRNSVIDNQACKTQVLKLWTLIERLTGGKFEYHAPLPRRVAEERDLGIVSCRQAGRRRNI